MAIKLPTWLPYDKLKHIIAGLMIFCTLWGFGLDINIALLATIVAALAKEFYDLFVKKTMFDFKDFVLTFAIPFVIWFFASQI